MSYDIEQFSFGVSEYGSELTSQCHQTLYWLNRNGYLSNEDTEDLLSRMVVTPIRNRPRFGQRLLARFFNTESSDNAYVFPISLVDDVYDNRIDDEPSDKPNLTVVK